MPDHRLLLVSLGPIQEFIASARRCRDLWFGSWLLSDLSKAAARAMAAEPGCGIESLVFPGATSLAALDAGRDTTVANKILVRVEGDAERVEAVAERGRSAMQERLRQLRDKAFAKVGQGDPKRSHHFKEETARRQVDDLIEYLWVSVQETGGPEAYRDARLDAERALAARKNTRTWPQPTWGLKDVPKSSLDGVRESVLDEDLFDPPVSGGRRDPALSPEQRRVQYGIHGSERLCGVGLLKRHGVMMGEVGSIGRERFFSTSHLAAQPLMQRIMSDAKRSDLEKKWMEFVGYLAAFDGLLEKEFSTGSPKKSEFFGRLDGVLLFESRLSEVLKEWKLDVHLPKALKLQREFLKIAADESSAEPIPYFAILVADGDRMGAVIDHQPSFGDHRRLSIALDDFAQQARDIVEQHGGSAIYAGGDDVMAFVPLHRALACAETLAQRFREKLGSWQDKDGNAPTLSAGLGIVHHLEPMDVSLKVARDAEKLAKRSGRNALCIAVDKRSGSKVEVVGQWAEFVEMVKALQDLLQNDLISDKAGYELSSLARLMDSADPGDVASLTKILDSESRRILGRKRAAHGKEEVQKAALERLKAQVKGNPKRLADALYVAEQFARAARQAGEVTP